MGTFAGMKDAKRGYASNRLEEGDYVVRVDRCDHFEAEAAGEGYKITLTVLAAERGKHKEGEVATVTYFLKPGTLGGKKQWFGNIKSFIASVMNVDDEAIDEGATVRTLDPEQVLAGTVCRVKSIGRLSKKSKKDDGTPNEFFLYNWSPSLENAEIVQTLGEERVKRFFPNGL